MKTLSPQLKIQSMEISNPLLLKKNILSLVFVIMILSIALYLFFIISTTIKISESKKFASEKSILQTEVSELEGNYLSIVYGIDEEKMASNGFSNYKVVEFVSAKEKAQSVAMAQ